MTGKTGLCRTVASLEDDLRLAEVNLRDAQRRNRELEKEMQQIIARQGSCPYVASSAEGTQFCRLNGALESVLEAIDKELEGFGYRTYEITSFRNASDGRSYQFCVTFGESILNAHERVTFPVTSIVEAATDCLEEIRKVKRGD